MFWQEHRQKERRLGLHPWYTSSLIYDFRQVCYSIQQDVGVNDVEISFRSYHIPSVFQSNILHRKNAQLYMACNNIERVEKKQNKPKKSPNTFQIFKKATLAINILKQSCKYLPLLSKEVLPCTSCPQFLSLLPIPKRFIL